MKKYLLPNGLPFFKANLHCHTTESDGHLTPDEIKSTYKEKGYSVIAFTDHEILVPHPQLNDPEFLALNGYELEVIEDEPEELGYCYHKVCHIGLIALEPDNFKQVFWNRLYVKPEMLEQHSELIREYRDVPNTRRIYSVDGISDMMKTARENGYFVIHNHPIWSQEALPDIINYDGMHALEIYNHMSVSEGYDDYTPILYDSLLRNKRRIYCVAADDNHEAYGQFGGYTMICAEKLAYRTITKALEDGHFYASTGPEIKELWFEDGHIHISCSPAERIIATYGSRRKICAHHEGAEMTEASFPVPKDDGYVRLTVWDKNGKHADTNAYFTDDLY